MLTEPQSMFEQLPESIKHGGEIIESKKRRQASSPQSLASRPKFLSSDDFMAPRRASTFPEAVSEPKRTTLSHSLPISQSHLASLGLDPNYSSSSPSNGGEFFDVVPGLTPASSTGSLPNYSLGPTHTPQQRSAFPATPLGGNYPDPSGLDVPDISGIMFPSSDPLAYPNPPMTTFESRHPHMFDRNSASPVVGMPPQMSGIDVKSFPTSGFRRPDADTQMFGQMPMYMQQRPTYQGSPNAHLTSNNIQFDDLMTHEEWANTFLDPNMAFAGRQFAPQQAQQNMAWR